MKSGEDDAGFGPNYKKVGCAIESGIIEDISYMSQGNLRRDLHLRTSMGNKVNLVGDLLCPRPNASSHHASRSRRNRKGIEGPSRRFKVDRSQGEKNQSQGWGSGRNRRLLNNHGLDPDDVVDQMHSAIVSRRLPLSDPLRNELLQALAECSKSLRRTLILGYISSTSFIRLQRAGQLFA